jgi:hypothetical protein
MCSSRVRLRSITGALRRMLIGLETAVAVFLSSKTRGPKTGGPRYPHELHE